MPSFAPRDERPSLAVRGVDAMVRTSFKVVATGLIALGFLGAPAISAAESCDRTPRIRSVQARQVANGSYRPAAARRAPVQYIEVEREPQRTKTKTALMIAGSAAAGAGVGGALSGKKGALIGAAVGGGAASIYEAAKRR
jgi:hypothetical protein